MVGPDESAWDPPYLELQVSKKGKETWLKFIGDIT
jgi:hypothetical protein